MIATGLAGVPASAQAPAVPASAIPRADALYARREEPGQARAAADLWAGALARDATNFEAAWKLAKARYWLGTHGPEGQRRADLEAGIEAARTAIALRPRAPEGHFWLAANMGALAESFGLRQGIKYRKPIKAALEEVLRIDPAYEQGSADRALGRWYFKVPRLFGGSNEKSEQHLRRALTYNPQSTVTWFFLAETLLDMGRRDEAREALQRVLLAPVSEGWGPEDREWKKKASQLLASLEARKR